MCARELVVQLAQFYRARLQQIAAGEQVALAQGLALLHQRRGESRYLLSRSAARGGRKCGRLQGCKGGLRRRDHGHVQRMDRGRGDYLHKALLSIVMCSGWATVVFWFHASDGLGICANRRRAVECFMQVLAQKGGLVFF